MNIVAAYEQVGTYRGAAALCGTTHKTVRRVVEAQQAGRADLPAGVGTWSRTPTWPET